MLEPNVAPRPLAGARGRTAAAAAIGTTCCGGAISPPWAPCGRHGAGVTLARAAASAPGCRGACPCLPAVAEAASAGPTTHCSGHRGAGRRARPCLGGRHAEPPPPVCLPPPSPPPPARSKNYPYCDGSHRALNAAKGTSFRPEELKNTSAEPQTKFLCTWCVGGWVGGEGRRGLGVGMGGGVPRERSGALPLTSMRSSPPPLPPPPLPVQRALQDARAVRWQPPQGGVQGVGARPPRGPPSGARPWSGELPGFSPL